MFQTSRSRSPNPTRHVASPQSAPYATAQIRLIICQNLTRCHFAAGGFRHLVSKGAWGLLAFEGANFPHAGLSLGCALGTEQERKLCQQVISAARDLSASHAQGSPAAFSDQERAKPQSWSLLRANENAAPASTAYSNLRFEYVELDIWRLPPQPRFTAICIGFAQFPTRVQE